MGGSQAIGSLENGYVERVFDTFHGECCHPRYMQNIVQICLRKTLQIWYAD